MLLLLNTPRSYSLITANLLGNAKSENRWHKLLFAVHGKPRNLASRLTPYSNRLSRVVLCTPGGAAMERKMGTVKNL